ncbi:MAG TPA: glycosyltransferase [Terriglobales bacterium]|nr:glycosyltransferase [Terriglobales bacterium]
MSTPTRLASAVRLASPTARPVSGPQVEKHAPPAVARATASVLILTKNEACNISHCLEAVLSQESPGRPEVILIDSGSSDHTVQIAGRYPVQLYRIAAESFHHARTRNLAAELAQGEYLVYLAADALPSSQGWLGALLRNFEDSTVGAVYGRHVPRPDASIERQGVLSTMYGDKRLVKSAACKAELGYRYYHFSTVNCAIRKQVWQQSRFPQDLNVCEDVAIATRILDAGWKIVYEPEAAVYHTHDFSSLRLFRRYFDLGVVYRRLNIWDRNNKAMLLRDGLRSLRDKLNLSQNHYGIAARSAGACQDAAKYAGLVLGRNERFIPRALKRRLSTFGLFE